MKHQNKLIDINSTSSDIPYIKPKSTWEPQKITASSTRSQKHLIMMQMNSLNSNKHYHVITSHNMKRAL